MLNVTIYRRVNIREGVYKYADFTGIYRRGVWRKAAYVGSISVNCRRNVPKVSAIIAHAMIADTYGIDHL